jgi:hypothetical protein
MAVKNLFASTSETFKVVSSKDEALAEDFSAEEYAAYLKDLDETKLRRRPENNEPWTIFHLRLATKLEDELRGKNSLASIGMAKGEVALYTVMTELVRTALVDITCGAESLMQKAGGGKASDDLMLGLVRSNIVVDLFGALQARESGAAGQGAVELTKKN